MTSHVEPALQFSTAEQPLNPIAFAIDEESFQVSPWLPGMKFLNYSRMMNEGGLEATILVDTFFKDVMDPAEYERFSKFCNDPGRRVDSQLLANIFLSLFARYSTGPKEQDRPTQPPEPSSLGREQTADSSKESSSSEASTPDA